MSWPRDRILHLLKTKGPLTTTEIGRRSKTTHEAARQVLAELRRDGLVEFEERRGGVGRPARIWHLTEDAGVQFPDSHGELAVGLLSAMRSAFGEDGLEKLVAQRTRTQIKAYRLLMRGCGDLRARVHRLTEIRSAEGYMAECKDVSRRHAAEARAARRAKRGALDAQGPAQPHSDSGSERAKVFEIIENHCPICAAAEACQGLCAGELKLFRAVLGPGVAVERTEHLLDGARRCVYLVRTA